MLAYVRPSDGMQDAESLPLLSLDALATSVQNVDEQSFREQALLTKPAKYKWA